MPPRVKLIVVEGPMKGRTFQFEGPESVLFGRQSDCHVRLHSDNLVSRHHFLLEVNPPLVRIRDLGSHNGTYVNGVRYGGRPRKGEAHQATDSKRSQADLQHDDRIRAGRSTLVVKIELDDAGTMLLCSSCGRDVSAEPGSGGSGDYLCEACRRGVKKSPLDLLAHEIPGYRIRRPIGMGSFGAVYLATKEGEAQPVAIKVLLSKVAVDEQFRRRFLREIASMRELDHPNIVPLLDSGAVASAFYFIMEYCDGGSVKDLMKRRRSALPLDEALGIILGALEGLAWAHGRSIVHRDIKPQNILLRGESGEWIAKLADFGLAKNFQEAGFSGLTVTGSLAGTPPFMPREQLMNFKYVKPVSDVWSIAATFYSMLTRRVPKDFPKGRDPIETVLVGRNVPIRERDPTVPQEIAAVIDRALSDEMDERYATAGELLEALKAAL